LSATISYKTTLFNYFEVLKPRETSLLVFIGLCSAIIAANWMIPLNTISITVIALLLGSAGCNGLTNYLDRDVDARAMRTRSRALPSRRIYPPEKVLPVVIILIVIGLILASSLNPLCLVFGLVGTIASVARRKTVLSCTLFGIIAGCSPILIGWFAFRPEFDIKILLMCIMIAFWIPMHIWSVMVANREDYIKAGLHYFPMNIPVKTVVIIISLLSLLLYASSISLYFVTDFKSVYLIIANILGIMMVLATIRLIFFPSSSIAWQVYKISSFPYLGIIFIAMCLDILIR
jgi:heme o synthase